MEAPPELELGRGTVLDGMAGAVSVEAYSGLPSVREAPALRLGDVPDVVHAVARDVAGLGVLGPGIDRLALVGPLLGAVIPRHHRPVAGRFGISSRRERGPVGRTLAAAVRLSGCVFVEHVKGHA